MRRGAGVRLGRARVDSSVAAGRTAGGEREGSRRAAGAAGTGGHSRAEREPTERGPRHATYSAEHYERCGPPVMQQPCASPHDRCVHRDRARVRCAEAVERPAPGSVGGGSALVSDHPAPRGRPCPSRVGPVATEPPGRSGARSGPRTDACAPPGRPARRCAARPRSAARRRPAPGPRGRRAGPVGGEPGPWAASRARGRPRGPPPRSVRAVGGAGCGLGVLITSLVNAGGA